MDVHSVLGINIMSLIEGIDMLPPDNALQQSKGLSKLLHAQMQRICAEIWKGG